MNAVNKNLFTIAGFVKKNRGRGRTLGFPTANIDIAPDLSEGIFIGYTELSGKQLPSLVFIGASVTFDEIDKKAEIFILDHKQELYGNFIEVQIVKKLRDNIKFASKDELVEQMKKDEQEARKYFKKLLI